MDVKCERCNTEYEFDDALVSGRGTTVKCTNCGHKFKIRRGDGELADDYWNVTTGDGRTLVFTSLRELQRAIQGYLVERTDRLSRGGLPPKPIGQIPELAPFFDQREATKKGALSQTQANRSVKTQDGLGPAQAAAVAAHGGPPPMRPRQATRPDFPPPSQPIGDEQAGEKGKSTLIGTGPLSDQEAIPRPGPAAVPPPRPKSTPPPVPPPRAPMNTQPMQRPSVPSAPPLPASASTTPKPPPVPEKKSAAPPPPPAAAASKEPSTRPPEQVVIRTTPPPPPSPPTPKKASVPPVKAVEPEPPMRTRSLLSEIEDERRSRRPYESVPDLAPAQRRRPVGGFIVAVVVLGGLLTMAAVWAQKNLGGLSGKPTATAPTVDPRVADFLVAGEKALSDGNLDLAKEKLDKASALAEKDPHVLLGLARLAAVRADVPWLKLRLLPHDAADEQRLAKNEVTELAAAARKAADDALAVAPDDPAALRAKIDALRIADDREGARALVPKINASQNQPESAYVLAALDLAEPEPLLWSTIIERLKTASSAETGPGRARAALVYALARSGDVAGAKAEVERLSAMPRPHPLLALLRAFADKAKPKGDAGAAEAAVAADAGKPGTKIATGTSGGVGNGGIPSDPREMLVQAEKAKNKGDTERARTLYNAALEKNPNDSEAVAGLAALAYAQHDLNTARSEYKRVLSINPNYLPAQIGLADVEWDSGNHDGATKMYKDIVDGHAEGTYPARVKTRSEGSGG